MQPLPEGTHLIHIGPQKTGSTAIQWAMHLAREELRAHGVVYPGPGPRPRAAAAAGLGFDRMNARDGDSVEAWEDLLRQVHEPAARRVCISLEAFARATDEQARRIVEELGGERPHVVAVARRYDALMPSQWQQRVKTQLRLSYDEWLGVVLGDPAPEDQHWSNLWVPHDTVALLDRWSALVGPDNVTLIVADEADHALLPRAFEQLLDLPDGMLSDRGGRANTSLTYEQAELLRLLNVVFHDRGWEGRPYVELVRRGVVPALLAEPRSPEARKVPPVPDWARARLVELSDRRIDGLSRTPVRVVGDLELLRVPPAGPVSTTSTEPATVRLETAVAALAGMAEAAEKRQQPERAGKKARRGIR